MKTCRKCGCEKQIQEFYSDKKSPDGKRAHCKTCALAVNARWRKANKARKSETARRHRELNREKIAAAKKKYYEENKERILAAQKQYYENNRERCRQTRREWYKRNRDDNLEYQKRWREENDERCRATSKRWREENKDIVNARYHRKKADPEFRATIAMRTMLNNFLRNAGSEKTGSTHAVLGYSYEEFKTHIERQFQKGMGWHNRHLWHIDHIVPVSDHIRRGETDPAVVNALTNLRPVWSADNLRKGGRRTHLV